MLGRLAGAEERLSKTQFGFRLHRGTTDAIFAARRYIERAWAGRSSQVLLLALDWNKAFDSVNPDAMAVALRRFRLPEFQIDLISKMYSERRFRVMDGQALSEERPQRSGISQGCPLYSFIFVILMGVVMKDAVRLMSVTGQKMHDDSLLASLLYADDTLLTGESNAALQHFLDAVASFGASCGLELHLDTTTI